MAEGSLVTEEMRSAIGSWHLPQFPPQTVGRWAIGRYLDALKDTNPLWRDEEYAKKTRWGGIIAPPAFVEMFNPIYLNARAGWKHQIEFPFMPSPQVSFIAYEEYEFLAPLRLGDVITGSGVLGDIYAGREGLERGRVVTRIDKEYHNHESELVARTKSYTMALDSRLKAANWMPPVSTTFAPPKDSVPTLKQVCSEDVAVGTDLPLLVRDISAYTVMKWAGASGDLALEHIDYEYATKKIGLPNATVQGHLIGAYMALLITNWIGGWGVFKKHYVEHVGNAWPGFKVIFNGKVSKKYVQDGEHFVECLIVAENLYGQRFALGRSLVTLPLRSEVPPQ